MSAKHSSPGRSRREGRAPREDASPTTRAAGAIQDVVAAILRQTAARHGAVSSLQQQWSRVVGKALAHHTRPVSVRRGVVYIQADEPGAGFTLSLQTPQLVQRLRHIAGPSITGIVIRPGG